MLHRAKAWLKRRRVREATETVSPAAAARIFVTRALKGEGAKRVHVFTVKRMPPGRPLPEGPFEFYSARGVATTKTGSAPFEITFWLDLEKKIWVPWSVEHDGRNVFDLDSSLEASRATGQWIQKTAEQK